MMRSVTLGPLFLFKGPGQCLHFSGIFPHSPGNFRTSQHPGQFIFCFFFTQLADLRHGMSVRCLLFNPQMGIDYDIRTSSGLDWNII